MESDKEEGELLIGGIGLAAGYLHAPDLTMQRFIPNPFGNGKLYRTVLSLGEILSFGPRLIPPRVLSQLDAESLCVFRCFCSLAKVSVGYSKRLQV